MGIYLTLEGKNRFIGIAFYVSRFLRFLHYNNGVHMKTILATLTQFRDILTLIEGNLVRVNFDISLDVFTLDGVDYHLIVWYKRDWNNEGALYESKRLFTTASSIDARWTYHSGIVSQEDDMYAAMKDELTK